MLQQSIPSSGQLLRSREPAALASAAGAKQRRVQHSVTSFANIRHRCVACCAHQGHSQRIDRRQAVAGLLLLLGLGSQQQRVEATEQQRLPKAYVTVVQNIIKSLRESLAAEVDGSKEYEIRRKADPAKENVREFVGKWRDDSRVAWHPSHQEIQAAIIELGQFYQSAGPRARLSPGVQQSVSAHLDAAQEALAASQDSSPSDGKGQGSLLGLFSGA